MGISEAKFMRMKPYSSHFIISGMDMGISGMDMGIMSLSIMLPYLTIATMEVLIHIGNGGTSLRWYGNASTFDWNWPLKEIFFLKNLLCLNGYAMVTLGKLKWVNLELV